MTVGELIEQLQGHDPDLPVVFVDNVDGTCPVTGIHRQEATTFDKQVQQVLMLESDEGF